MLAQTQELNAEEEAIHRAETDLWLDTVFGYCLAQVASETWSDHPEEIRGNWNNIRSDYSSTLLKPLYDAKVSAFRGTVIVDLNPEATSCWTQYASLVPDYTASKLAVLRDGLIAEDRLKLAYVDQGVGPQLVEVILVGDNKVPVIFYQADGSEQSVKTIVTIIQKTEPGFAYFD